MPQIPPIDDAYIDDIIKSAGPYNEAINKTQGARLRELMKRFRDYFEEQTNTSGLTFSNGLTKTGDSVTLGGNYTNPIISIGTGSDKGILGLSSAAATFYGYSGAELIISTSSPDGYIGIDMYQQGIGGERRLTFGGGNRSDTQSFGTYIMIHDEGDGFEMSISDEKGIGLTEEGDYSANKKPFSYVTKKMLNEAIGKKAIRTVTGSTTLTTSDYTIIKRSGSSVIFTLPAASTCSGQIFKIVSYDSYAEPLTFNIGVKHWDLSGFEVTSSYMASLANSIIGASPAPMQTLTIQSNGIDWYAIGL
ncbi:hypothetical protein [Pedobacter frigiditerrae]|uniref:hypothetical protein n=1 Tax=Pedobacter frigiditerrae TaxID=2530452 RepID=UPI0029300182|nr:hypothetical protein [Pedobacter frigiditerrae]